MYRAIVCFFLCFFIGALGVLQAQDNVPTSPPTTNSDLILQEAQDLIDEAQEFYSQQSEALGNSLSIVNNFIGFISVGVGLAALLSFYNFAQMNAQINQTAEVAEQSRRVAQAFGLGMLASRQVDMGNWKAALEIYLSAAELNPEDRVVNYFIGDLYLRLGKAREGISYLERARQGSKFSSAEASYAYALRLLADEDRIRDSQRARYQDVEKILKNVYKDDPYLLDISGESVFGTLASLYRRIGDIEQAIEWYEHAHRVTPKDTYPLNNLAILYYRHRPQERAKALEYFQEARTKGLRTLHQDVQNYWVLFDLITAEIALEEADYLQRIQDYLKRIQDLKPSKIDIRKLFDGLEELKQSKPQPTGIHQGIDVVKKRLEAFLL